MKTETSALGFDEICRLLPQAYPFVLLDRVEELTAGERIVALKNISGNEWMFPGHFPRQAIYPGVLLIESMAQAAILLFKVGRVETEGTFLLAGVKSRFLRPVVPGDQVRLICEAQKVISTAAIVEAQATVNDEVAAKAELTFAIR